MKRHDAGAGESISWKHYPSFVALKALCAAVRVLPRRLVWRLFSWASVIGSIADVRHRLRALRNLDIAFGDGKGPAEKRRIVREAFRSLFLTTAEFILLPRYADRIRSVVDMPRSAVLAKALEKKRGVICLVSHFGNWELMAHRGVADGYRIASVGRPMSNPLIYREIIRLREYTGAVSLEKKWVAREIVQRLRNNWCVAILSDQYAGRDAPFVPFFGRPVSTSPAAALLAMKTGAVVLPAFNVREAPGRHTLHICDPVEIVTTGDRRNDIIENCTRINRVIEEWVRRHPGQWLWMARRWRPKRPSAKRLSGARRGAPVPSLTAGSG